MPMANFLSQESMPPRYSLGITALVPLSRTDSMWVHWNRVETWAKSCWESLGPWSSTATGPHLFRTAAILDSLFDNTGKDNLSASITARDASINETYKWVATATAAQFTAAISQGETSNTRYDNSQTPRARCQDIALAAWRKAKQMVFENISAMGSFRLALSLFLFGHVQPPHTDKRRIKAQEDARFALCEGLGRLQKLCSQARLCLHAGEEAKAHRCFWNTGRSGRNSTSAHYTSSEVKDNVSELIGAIEWLFTMANAMKIVISRGTVCPLPLLTSNGATSPRSVLSDQIHQGDTDAFLVKVRAEKNQSIEDFVLERSGFDSHAVTTIWHHKNDSKEPTLKAMRQSSFFVILLWKTLALLVVASENVDTVDIDYNNIRQLYTTAATLIRLWRSTFGVLDNSTAPYLQKSQTETRFMATHCLNDGDLAVLYFYSIAEELKQKLRNVPPSAARETLWEELISPTNSCREERLASAIQISILSSCSQGVFSPGFEGADGLKAHLQDIGAHPYPTLVVQANKLAAKVFADELHPLIARMDSKQVSKMTAGLGTCMQGLQELQQTLVTVPDLSDDEEDEAIY